MKRFTALLLVLLLLLPATSAEAAEDYKIAIMTPTTSQGEEEYCAALSLLESDFAHVLHDTYPDNFSSEVETTISKLLAFAQEPRVKAIVFVLAIQGATSAFTQIREDLGREDILLIAGEPAEDPADIAGAADLVMSVDEIGCGYQVADKAHEWGCDVIVHYSFARHMSYETYVAKRDVMKLQAELYGMTFVDRDCPDPTGEVGMSGAQAAVLEDIPKVMAAYAGKKVCFYCTNCGLQVALQQAVLENPDAYYVLPCCPSPYHGYQEAFGLSTTYGDTDAALRQLADFLKEREAEGRFSAWSVPLNMTMIRAGYAYAKAYCEGRTEGKKDVSALRRCFSEACGKDVAFEPYTDAEGRVYDNYLLVSMSPIDFGKLA